MNELWNAIFEQLGSASVQRRRRLTNLIIASIATLGRAHNQRISGARLRATSHDIAGHIGSTFKDVQCDWEVLAELGSRAGLVLTACDFDRWTEAFQAADPQRKTVGAYATPAVFADALAERVLKTGQDAEIPSVVDPAAGCGNLLLAALRRLTDLGHEAAEVAKRLYGVELDPAARELCIQQLWLAAGGRQELLGVLASNIVCANALTYEWGEGEAFDVLLMNPPWESLRHAVEGELQGPRADTLKRLSQPAKLARELPPLFTAHGRGDRNLFKAFVELAPHLVRLGGRLGLLLPAAFGSDLGMAALRHRYLEQIDIESWTTFENRAKYFKIDSRYKFGLLFGVRSQGGTNALCTRAFATHPQDLAAPHVVFSRGELGRVGGKDQMFPELVDAEEGALLLRILQAGSPLLDPGPLGIVRYKREVDLTLDRSRGLFRHVTEVDISSSEMVPLLEGRMVGPYDCFQKSWVSGQARSARWESNRNQSLDRCKPQFVAPPREPSPSRVALCDVTSATNTRTVIATLVPSEWRCGNTAPVLLFGDQQVALAGLAILNSMVFDWTARRIVSGLHLNRFYLSQMVWPKIDRAAQRRLAELGRIMCALSPRGVVRASASEAWSDLPERIAVMAAIEFEVATAYGLCSRDLERIATVDRKDRRGFWRYFDAEPSAVSAMALAVEALRSGKRPSSMRIAA